MLVHYISGFGQIAREAVEFRGGALSCTSDLAQRGRLLGNEIEQDKSGRDNDAQEAD